MDHSTAKVDIIILSNALFYASREALVFHLKYALPAMKEKYTMAQNILTKLAQYGYVKPNNGQCTSIIVAMKLLNLL